MVRREFIIFRENVGLASTCNSVGQSLGVFIGHAVFLNLASKDFSNKYFRSVPQSEGLVTLSSFMVIWSCIYFLTTTLIFLLKHEGNENHADDENTIFKSYVRLYEVSKLSAVRMCILFYMTKSVSVSLFLILCRCNLVLLTTNIHSITDWFRSC